MLHIALIVTCGLFPAHWLFDGGIWCRTWRIEEKGTETFFRDDDRMEKSLWSENRQGTACISFHILFSTWQFARLYFLFFDSILKSYIFLPTALYNFPDFETNTIVSVSTPWYMYTYYLHPTRYSTSTVFIYVCIHNGISYEKE